MDLGGRKLGRNCCREMCREFYRTSVGIMGLSREYLGNICREIAREYLGNILEIKV